MYGFGARLRDIRKSRKLTQKDLAKRIHKSVAAVSSYELDVQIPPVDVLTSIATVLNVSLDYLVGFENNEVFSSKSLSLEQKEVITLLYQEFASPTSQNESPISAHQLEIIQKLLLLFSN